MCHAFVFDQHLHTQNANAHICTERIESIVDCVAVVVVVINFVTKTGLIRCDTQIVALFVVTFTIVAEAAAAGTPIAITATEYFHSAMNLSELVYILIKIEANSIDALLNASICRTECNTFLKQFAFVMLWMRQQFAYIHLKHL